MQPEESRMRYCFFAKSQSIQLDLIQGSFIPFKNTVPVAQAPDGSCITAPPNDFSAARWLPELARITNT